MLDFCDNDRNVNFFHKLFHENNKMSSTVLNLHSKVTLLFSDVFDFGNLPCILFCQVMCHF